MYKINRNTPEDGFEPPLKEPESFVLPLDDSGKYLCKTILTLEKLFTTPQHKMKGALRPFPFKMNKSQYF